MAGAVSNQERRPASMLASKEPNHTSAAGVVQPTPAPVADERDKTIELQAARIKQLEDTVRQANEVISVQSQAIKKQEAAIIGQVGQINSMRIQISQARRN
jgi:hypothetical protein